jgi:hypothetical protein
MKVARAFARRRAQYWSVDLAARSARQRARQERQVRRGRLAPESLHFIPAQMVREATLHFPAHRLPTDIREW